VRVLHADQILDGDGHTQQRRIFPRGEFFISRFRLLARDVARQVDVGLHLTVHCVDAFVDGVEQFHRRIFFIEQLMLCLGDGGLMHVR